MRYWGTTAPQTPSLLLDWLVTAANWIYMWGHWPVIAFVALWLVTRRPAT